eukprot:evm.model.NODE_46608_length_3102_cov_11.686332.1
MGKVRAMACEPFVVFPIEERERALDQLRYLTAVSASASVAAAAAAAAAAGGYGQQQQQQQQQQQ